MSQANDRNKDLTPLQSKLLTILRGYNVCTEVLDLLYKEQLIALCEIIGAKPSIKDSMAALKDRLMAFKCDGFAEDRALYDNAPYEDIITLLEDVSRRYNDENGISYFHGDNNASSSSTQDDVAFDLEMYQATITERTDYETEGIVNGVYNRYFLQHGKYGPESGDPIITEDFYQSKKLQVGDKLRVHVKVKGPYEIIDEVMTVNGVPFGTKYCDPYISKGIIKPKKKIDFAALLDDKALGAVLSELTPLRFGERMIITTNTEAKMSPLLYNIRRALEKIAVVYTLDLKGYKNNVPESETEYRVVDKSDDFQFSTFRYVVANVKRDYADGKDIIFVIDALEDVMKLLVKYAETSNDRELEALSLFQDLFILARNTSTGGSITLLFTMNLNRLMDATRHMFTQDKLAMLFRGYCDGILVVDRSLEEFGLYPPIDVMRTITKNRDANAKYTSIRKRIRKGNYLLETEKVMNDILGITDDKE